MRAWLILAGATCAVSGCAHLPPAGDGLNFEQRRAQLESLPGWQMRGRLAIDTGDRGYQARFEWRQEADSLRLSLRGPLGAGGVEIAGSSAALTVRSRGETLELDDPEQQLSELLGWWLPVTSLDAWLIGLPDRVFEADTAFGPDGSLASLEQRLWHLDFAAYQLSNGWLVPRRIDMSYEKLEVRLIVDSWQPTDAARLN